MANSEELIAILRLDLADYLKSLGQAETKADGFLNGFKGKAALLAGDVIGTTARALVEGVGTVVSFSAEAAGAVNDLEARLGVTEERAEELGGVAKEVFQNNFGGSIAEATQAVGEVERALQSLGTVGSEELQKITEGAFALQDTFEVDMGASVDGVKALMSQFGLSSQESLDLITAGFQKGLPEDFLESITEYSIQFNEAGFSADQMFSILATGAEQGVLGTDKIGDAVKEFRIRFMEQGDAVMQASTDVFNALGESFQLDPNAVIAVSNDVAAVEEALLKLGFSADQIEGAALAEPLMVWNEELGKNVETARNFGDVVQELIKDGIADGTMTAADAFNLLTQGLSSFEDEFAANSAGAEIFGTQWEDLAGQFVDNVDMMAFGMDDLAGSADKLNARYENFGAIGEAAQRKLLVVLAPLGDKLLDLANNVAPVAFVALDWIGEELPKWVDTALGWFDTFSGDLGSFGGKFSGTFDTVKKITEDTGKIIEVVWGAISGFFDENGSTIIEILTTTFDTVFTVVDAALTIIARVIDTVLAIIEGDWDRVWDNILEITSTIINTVTTVIGNALDNIENAFSLLSNAIQSIWTSVMEWLEEKVGITVGFFDIDLFSAGAAIISSLWNGLRSKVDEMLGWLREQAQKISDLMPGSEPKDPTSPLRGLSNRGEAIMQNIQDGINRFGPLRLDLQSVVNQIGSGVSGVRADFQAGAASVINQISMDLRGSDGNEDRIRSVVNDAFREVVRDSRTLRLTG